MLSSDDYQTRATYLSNKELNVVKVAIVGAGAAGLCALRHLANQTSQTTQIVAVCFEQAQKVGGTWVYTDLVGKDENGLPIHSSMYQNLRTNLPKESMAFPDFAFPEELPSFMKHQDVQKYLEDYASHFDVLRHIKFQTIVKWIKPVPDETVQFKTKWEVTWANVLESTEKETSIFDAVLLCQGHYAIPVIPDIPGLDSFQGHVLHSHDYRRPNDFEGKTVVLLGASSSGQDICLILATVAKKVYLSHNKPRLTTPLPENVTQKLGINKVSKEGIEFVDGSIEEVDAVMFCSGYHYDFSFLAPEIGIEVNNGRVTPLYKHFLHTKFPNFGMIGLMKIIVPFPVFDLQARFFRALLDGMLILPSEEEMNQETEEDYKARIEAGLPHRYAHIMGERQFGYCDDLADMAKTSRLPEHYKKIFSLVHHVRTINLMGYKNMNLSVSEQGDIAVV